MKTFDQYINEYLANFNYNITCDNIRYWLCDDNLMLIRDSYKNQGRLYEFYPFEFNLGLFKFICDDLNLDWFKILNNIKLGIPRTSKLHDICPIEFINIIIGL